MNYLDAPASSVNLSQQDESFSRFLTATGKQYLTTREMQARSAVYSQNMAYINERNQQLGLTYKLAANKFADLTNAEFKQMLGRVKNPNF